MTNGSFAQDAAGTALHVVSDIVLELASKVPVFGELVGTLEKIIQVVETVQINKEACLSVGLWAGTIKQALVRAAPILLEADAMDKNAMDLMALLTRQVEELLQMSIQFSNRRYIVKLLTSKSFKELFDETKESASSLMMCMQLLMQSVQLRLQADASYTKVHEHVPPMDGTAVGQLVMGNMQDLSQAMQVLVQSDDKLDAIITQQHESLLLLKKQSEQQGQTNMKIEDLIDMVARIDPSAGPKKYAFSVSATMNQVWDVNMTDMMNQMITTHAGIITPWVTAEASIAPDNVLNQTEWVWMGAFLGTAWNHDFGKIPATQILQLGPRIQTELTPKVVAAVTAATKILKLQERGITLSLLKLNVSPLGYGAEFTIQWPPTGPWIKSSKISDSIHLLVVAAGPAPAPPPSMDVLFQNHKQFQAEAHKAQEAECCTIL
jgi:hypothetical protein